MFLVLCVTVQGDAVLLCFIFYFPRYCVDHPWVIYVFLGYVFYNIVVYSDNGYVTLLSIKRHICVVGRLDVLCMVVTVVLGFLYIFNVCLFAFLVIVMSRKMFNKDNMTMTFNT